LAREPTRGTLSPALAPGPDCCTHSAPRSWHKTGPLGARSEPSRSPLGALSEPPRIPPSPLAAFWRSLLGTLLPGTFPCRRALGLSAYQWGLIDAEEREELLGKELWESDNLEAYNEEMGIGGDAGAAQKPKKPSKAKQRKAALRGGAAEAMD